MKKLNSNEIFQNRALLENSSAVFENDCEHCYEPLVFALKNNDTEFSVGLFTILNCLQLAEKNGDVPAISRDWWITIQQKYSLGYIC